MAALGLPVGAGTDRGPEAIRAHLRARARRRRQSLLLLSLLLAGAAVLGVAVGSVAIRPSAIAAMLWKAVAGGAGGAWAPADEAIILQVRLPRVAAGALAGAALAVAGVLFQGLLRNPLADPYIIGTSAGAAFAAAVAQAAGLHFTLLGFGVLPVAAFVGGLVTSFAVYAVARIGGRAPVVNLLLAGLVMSSILLYAMSLLMVLSETLQAQMRSLFTVLMGGIIVTGWRPVAIVAPMVAFGVAAACPLAHRLNALTLGEEGAAAVGVDVERDKRRIIALGAFLTACAVSLSGIIGFAGLVVPHVLRLTAGPDHRGLIPGSALLGAAFLVVADALARSLFAPAEVPVGVFTALVGGPFFLLLLRRARREYRF
jgi:ABC-type Fe3+-siderophore transport system permease subunit